MLVLVVLGNRLNDDGTISELMRERLNLALQVENRLAPQIIVLSGGVANKKAKVSEAEVMQRILVQNGVALQKIVQENKSLTTKQNAQFSVPIALQKGATQVLVCTSAEHMHRTYLNPIKLFAKQLKKHPEVTLLSCCCLDELEHLCSTICGK